MQFFTETFPPSIYPAILILAVVFLRLRTFYRHHDFMQFGRSIPEIIMGGIYLVDSFCPFATIDRIVLLRNTIMVLFGVEFFYQAIIVPKMRRLSDGTK